MTLIEIKQKGYEALITALGPVDTVRFLQQVGRGEGNYTEEREQLLSSVTKEDLKRDLERLRARKNS